MRTLRIELVEEAGGRKLVAHRTFEATAILLLDAETAGEGFLALAKSMVEELDRSGLPGPVAPAPPEPPEPEPPIPAERLVPPEDNPYGLTPERLAEIERMTAKPKRKAGKK